MIREEGPVENSVTYADVKVGFKATMTPGGFSYESPDREFFYFRRTEVLALRNVCNSYMKEFGAVDSYGREVIDKESGNV